MENLSRIVRVQVYSSAYRRVTVIYIYNVGPLLLLSDRKQCFGLSVLSRMQSYRQSVACRVADPDHRITDHRPCNSNTLGTQP